MITKEQEARMVIAHKHGRRKAQLGFNRDYVVNLAQLLPTSDERDAFIAGYDGELRKPYHWRGTLNGV